MKKLASSFSIGTLGRRKSPKSSINQMKEDEKNATKPETKPFYQLPRSNFQKISKLFERKRKAPTTELLKVEKLKDCEEKSSLRRTKSYRVFAKKTDFGVGTNSNTSFTCRKVLHNTKDKDKSPLMSSTSSNISIPSDSIISKTPDKSIQSESLRRIQKLKIPSMRENVIKELLQSEITFLNNLRDVTEGYLIKCRYQTKMFSSKQIEILFGNIEEIFCFQKQFVKKIQQSINFDSINNSLIGPLFLENEDKFIVYSKYCNNHPFSSELLQQFLTMKKYSHFFEVCRLRQKMIDIPIDGFLLTPIQKICKYPLQLNEMLKHTPTNHPDYDYLIKALLAMKNVAEKINEEKRRLEHLNRIRRWQTHIANWQGSDIDEDSSRHIYSGEVFISVGRAKKAKLRIVYLFDNQLVICKKDVLRRDIVHFISRHETSSIKSIFIQNVPVAIRLKERNQNQVQNRWWRLDGNNFMFCDDVNDQLKWEKAFNIESKLKEYPNGIMSKSTEFDAPCFLNLGELDVVRLQPKRAFQIKSLSTSTDLLSVKDLEVRPPARRFASLRRKDKTRSHIF